MLLGYKYVYICMKRLWQCWKAGSFKINGNQTLLGWTTCFNIALGKVKCLLFIHGLSHTGFLFRSFFLSSSGGRHRTADASNQLDEYTNTRRNNNSISWRNIQDSNFEGHSSFQVTVQHTLPTVKMSGNKLACKLPQVVSYACGDWSRTSAPRAGSRLWFT